MQFVQQNTSFGVPPTVVKHNPHLYVYDHVTGTFKVRSKPKIQLPPRRPPPSNLTFTPGNQRPPLLPVPKLRRLSENKVATFTQIAKKPTQRSRSARSTLKSGPKSSKVKKYYESIAFRTRKEASSLEKRASMRLKIRDIKSTQHPNDNTLKINRTVEFADENIKMGDPKAKLLFMTALGLVPKESVLKTPHISVQRLPKHLIPKPRPLPLYFTTLDLPPPPPKPVPQLFPIPSTSSASNIFALQNIRVNNSHLLPSKKRFSPAVRMTGPPRPRPRPPPPIEPMWMSYGKPQIQYQSQKHPYPIQKRQYPSQKQPKQYSNLQRLFKDMYKEEDEDDDDIIIDKVVIRGDVVSTGKAPPRVHYPKLGNYRPLTPEPEIILQKFTTDPLAYDNTNIEKLKQNLRELNTEISFLYIILN